MLLRCIKSAKNNNDTSRCGRSIGMKTNAKSLSDGIASGHYPFGTILHVGKTGRRHIRIFRTEYERWKAEVLLGTGPSPENTAPIVRGNLELISTHTYTQEDKEILWEVIIRSWAKKS